MSRGVKVEGTSFIRDMGSKSLAETNVQKAADYKARRERMKQIAEDNRAEINSLRDELRELKEAFMELLKKESN